MRSRSERGSGTVVVLAAVSTVAAGCLAVLGVAAAMVTHGRAGAAADAAALAAAGVAGIDPPRACARAELVARANDAVVSDCTATGPVAEVTVDVAPPAWLSWAGTARLNARAGPTETYEDQPGRVRSAS